MLPFLLSAAVAAPFGNPARTADTALVAAQLGGAWQGSSLDTGCEGERCSSWAVASGGELRLDLRPHSAIGAWGSGSWTKEDLGGTGHIGWGPHGSAGLSLQWPREGVSPALCAKGEIGRTVVSAGPEQDPRSESRSWTVSVASVAAFGEPEGGAVGWIGPTMVVAEHRALDVNTEDVTIELTRGVPFGVVAGGELVSAPLGQPWRRSGRMMAGVEVQAVHAWGASAWIGVSY